MKKIMGIVLLSLLIGCVKGEKGDRGDPGTINNYSGPITSNDMFVSVPSLGTNSSLSVSIVDSYGKHEELPFYSPALGANIYYVAMSGLVEIFNAKQSGLSSYRIVVINGH